MINLLTAPQRLAAAVLTTVVALGALWIAWTWHGHREYKRGKDEMAALVKAESDKVTALREEIGKARKEGAAEAEAKFKIDLTALETQREALETLARDRGTALNRLRATAATRPREVDIDPGDSCRDPKLRAQQADRLLAEGQGLAIEGAGLVGSFAGLVGEGEVSLGEHTALMRLAQRWAASVQIGKDQ